MFEQTLEEEKSAKDYAELDKIAGDLAVLVMRLARALRNADNDNPLSNKALKYLIDHDFINPMDR